MRKTAVGGALNEYAREKQGDEWPEGFPTRARQLVQNAGGRRSGPTVDFRDKPKRLRLRPAKSMIMVDTIYRAPVSCPGRRGRPSTAADWAAQFDIGQSLKGAKVADDIRRKKKLGFSPLGPLPRAHDCRGVEPGHKTPCVAAAADDHKRATEAFRLSPFQRFRQGVYLIGGNAQAPIGSVRRLVRGVNLLQFAFLRRL